MIIEQEDNTLRIANEAIPMAILRGRPNRVRLSFADDNRLHIETSNGELGDFDRQFLISKTQWILRGYRAAARVEDGYARSAAAGLFALFGLQAVINLSVNLALIPPKGMTLPFVSSGGSSMIGTGLTLGLALALVRGQGTRIRGRYG